MYVGVGKGTAGGTVDETFGGGTSFGIAGEFLEDVIEEREVMRDGDIRKLRSENEIMRRFLISLLCKKKCLLLEHHLCVCVEIIISSTSKKKKNFVSKCNVCFFFFFSFLSFGWVFIMVRWISNSPRKWTPLVAVL